MNSFGLELRHENLLHGEISQLEEILLDFLYYCF